MSLETAEFNVPENNLEDLIILTIDFVKICWDAIAYKAALWLLN